MITNLASILSYAKKFPQSESLSFFVVIDLLGIPLGTSVCLMIIS